VGGNASRDDKDEPHIPFALLICMLVMALTFVIVIPIIGFMYMDMNNAVNQAVEINKKAVEEIKKMRDLRARILLETIEEK